MNTNTKLISAVAALVGGLLLAAGSPSADASETRSQKCVVVASLDGVKNGRSFGFDHAQVPDSCSRKDILDAKRLAQIAVIQDYTEVTGKPISTRDFKRITISVQR